jgi:long-chain fatty acid transport protein
MRRLTLCAGALAVAATLLGQRAWAGGFEIYDQSPSGTAMAGAVSAKADEPASMFYNPALMAMRTGGVAMVGSTIAFVNFDSSSAMTMTQPSVKTSTQGGIFYLPTLHVSGHIGDKLAVGLGVYTPYGSGSHWNDMGTTSTGSMVPFPGRFVASNTQLQTAVINPTIGVRPNEMFSIGLGIDVMLASVELQRSILFGDQEGSAHLGGSTTGVGFNFGVLANVIPKRLAIGLAYRSAIGLDFNDLKVHFVAPPELKDNVFDQSASTSLKMPHSLTFGIATYPVKNLTITTDVHYTIWSDFKSLAVAFAPNSPTPGFSADESWHDSVSVRVGGEYIVLNGLAIRLGVGYDISPIPDRTLAPTVPLGDIIIVSGGLGYTYRGFGLAAGYVYGIPAQRTSTNPDFIATYNGSLMALSVALSYQWDKQ